MNFDSFKKKLYSQKDKVAVFDKLKYNITDFEKLLKVISRIESEMPGFRGALKNALFGSNPFPNSYNKLHIGAHQFSDNLKEELNWETASLLKNSEVINSFLALQHEFEKFQLIGEYDKSRELLNRIENEISFSYWTLENRFILDEYQFGHEKNWETRNTIVDKKNNVYVRNLGNLFSIKAEQKMPFSKYNEETLRWEESVGINNSQEFNYLVEYFRFKSNHFLQDKYISLSEIITLERSASAIDRYLMFKRVAQRIVIDSAPDLESTIQLVQALCRKINDIELKQILLSQGHDVIEQDDFHEVLSAIDSYTIGDYSKCQRSIINLIGGDHSNNIDLLEIFAKATIEGNLVNQNLTVLPSLLNEIKDSFFEILLKGPETNLAVLKLLKLSYVFNNSHIGLKIYSFICRELGWKTITDYGYLGHISSRFYNIQTWENIYRTHTTSLKFITQFVNSYPASSTVKLYSAFYAAYNGSEINLSNINVPEKKELIYDIRILIQKEQYSSAINVCVKALTQFALSPILEFEIVSVLYSAYLELDNLRDALVVYVDAYLKNQHLIKKCDAERLLTAIVKSKFKSLARKDTLIELPIFFKINSKEPNRIKQAFEQFITANQLTKPSEIFNLKDNLDKSKLIFFFKNVCTPEIMQLSKYLISTEMVNEQRILVCQFLAEHDTINIESYNSEIASTTQKNIISKVIGHFDERKIYVNDDKIKLFLVTNEKPSSNLKEHVASLNKDLFDRYTEMINYVSHQNEYKDDSLFLFGDESEQHAQAAFEKEIQLLLGKMNAAFHKPTLKIFEGFFHSIRELFINNEYGLDAYLSSKIRHGTLPNHLRSVFENYKLVTSQANGSYTENQHWKSQLSLSEERMIDVQLKLAAFSMKVDRISKIFKDEWIQCRTEKRNAISGALFDFSYTKSDILLLFLARFDEIKNYDFFIDSCLAELWDRTEKCLSKIRSKIHNELKNNFNLIISELEDDLLLKFERNEIHELLHNINMSRTEIQSKLANIANWFRRSESSFDGYYTLQTLVDTSIQIIKNINPIYKFSVDRSGSLDVQIKGEYHQHFIDLVTNFLQNMIEHPKIEAEHLNASLHFSSNIDGSLIGVFNNSFSEKVDEYELEQKLLNIQNNWKKYDSNVSVEKNSGFPKIKKILRSDLSRKHSQFSFQLRPKHLSISLTFETEGLIYENIDN